MYPVSRNNGQSTYLKRLRFFVNNKALNHEWISFMVSNGLNSISRFVFVLVKPVIVKVYP